MGEWREVWVTLEPVPGALLLSEPPAITSH